MAKNKKNLVGQRFGKWLVLEWIRAPHYKWKCECSCGSVSFVTTASLLAAKSTQCWDCGRLSTRKYGRIGSMYMHRINERARKRNLEVDLDYKYLEELFESQNGRCALSQVALRLPDDAGAEVRAASLDRIDSRRGYQRGNLQWVHPRVNWMKRALPMEEFVALCRAVSVYNRKEPRSQ